mgnify:CR=1 FL=1
MQNESIPDARGPVFCGVDTHADSHWLYVLDWRGRKVLSRQFPADAARAGHVRKRGQPCGRQRNVGSPRGPHLMVSTSMVYGCIIDVFNTENISAECSEN